MTKSNVGLHTIKVKRMYFDTSSDTNAVFLRPLLNGFNYVGSIFFSIQPKCTVVVSFLSWYIRTPVLLTVHVQLQECVQIKTSVTSWLSDLNCYFLEIVNTDNFNLSWKRNEFCNAVNDFV